MTLAEPLIDEIRTLGDLLHRLGDISADRVRMRPPPGEATEQDLFDLDARGDRICELLEGTLVEKPMGLEESILAIVIAAKLCDFVIPRNLGLVAGESGMFRLFPGIIRMPDVAYASHARRRGRPITSPAPDMAPDLAVEVISTTNTPAEMARKRAEYFSATVKLVWMFDPRARTVEIFTSVEDSTLLGVNDTLTGGDVLPGFSVAIKSLFDEMDQQMGNFAQQS
jgi:Uma2 family endonuclease